MRRLFLSLALCFAALPAFAAEVAPRTALANLTILADEDMLLPLTQLARSYASMTGTPCTVVLARGDETALQIEQGLEAHMLISANPALINRLTEQGLTDVTSRRHIARTQLALVTASKLSQQALLAKRISFASMLAATNGQPVFVDDASSYEGDRAQRLLTGQPFSETLAARIDVKASHEEVLESLRDSDGLALMLAADATAERDIHILALLPETISPPVTFDALILGSESMGASRELATYLASRPAQRIFAKFGFQPPN